MKTAFLKLVAISILAVSALAPVSVHAAGTASLSLGASAAQVAKGSSLSVSVIENGTDVNVVTAKLTYDASKFSCGAVSVSGAFPNKASSSCSGGSVTMSHYTNPGTVAPAGSLVGTVTLTAISDTGSAVVSTAAGSQVASNGTNTWNGVTSSVSIALTAPAPGRGSGVPTQTTTPAPKKTVAAAPATTNTATSADNAAAAAPKTEDKQVAAATDTKPAAEAQPAAPAAAKPSNKVPMYIGVALLAAAAVAFAFRKKLSAVLANAKEA